MDGYLHACRLWKSECDKQNFWKVRNFLESCPKSCGQCHQVTYTDDITRWQEDMNILCSSGKSNNKELKQDKNDHDDEDQHVRKNG